MQNALSGEIVLKLGGKELLALPISSQMPYELLALVVIRLLFCVFFESMHVLILALRRGMIKTKFAYFFLAQCFSHNFDRMILRKKERGTKPSCPPIFWLIKKATRTFNFYESFYW